MAKLYVDLLSQPSRACVIFCRLHSLPVEIVPVDLGKGQHTTSWYKSINPLGKVPFYTEGDFSLAESAAILWYLAEANSAVIEDHWYPKDIKQRSKTVSVCHWQHSTLRPGAAYLVRQLVLDKAPSSSKEAFVKHYHDLLYQSLQVLETYWLNHSPYSCGDLPSIADLLCCCEIEQLRLLDATPNGPHMEDILSNFPNVQGWLSRVQTFCEPVYHSVHHALRHVAAILKDRRHAPVSKM